MDKDDPDLYEGACFRNFVKFASEKGPVVDPFLSRVDADSRSLDLTGMRLGDPLGEAQALCRGCRGWSGYRWLATDYQTKRHHY